MVCLQSLCASFLVIGLCSGQVVDVFSTIESIETVSSDYIEPPMECGGEYTQNTGRITSPGYPVQNYSFASNCTWSIKVDKGQVLVMTFEYMDLEIEPPDCLFDGVIVVDDSGLDPIPFTPSKNPFGASWTHQVPTVLGKFCGSDLPKPFVSVTNSVRVGFYSDLGIELSGFVFSWRTVDAKPTVHQSCDFEDGLCDGWQNMEKGDNFDWKILSGKTPSSGSNTGPHFDHTKQNEDGLYAYIEASSPRVANEIAILVSPETKFRDDDSDYCLDFWYHMRGSQMGSLGVGLLIGNRQERKWAKSGEQGDEWNHESITIKRIESPFKILFAGVVGQSHKSDIAIDDIKLYGKPCSELTLKDKMSLLEFEVGLYTEPCVSENEFHCMNASTCIAKDKLCNGIIDCPLMDDEDSDTCKDNTLIPPPIEGTTDTPLDETTGGNTAEYDSTSSYEATADFGDTTTEDSEKIIKMTEVLPRETNVVEISTTSPLDATASDEDLTTEYPDPGLDTTVVLRRETTHIAPTTTAAITSTPATIESDLTTIEDDFEMDTTETEIISTTIYADEFTTESATEEDEDETFPSTVLNPATQIVKEQELVTKGTTPFSTWVGDITTKPKTQPVDTKSSETTESVSATTDLTGDQTTSFGTGEIDKLTTPIQMHKSEHVFIPTTAHVLLNRLESSTKSTFVSSTSKTSTSRSDSVVNAEASNSDGHRSTVTPKQSTTQSVQEPNTMLPNSIETTTELHAVGNLEVPTMADKHKGGNGSSMTSPVSLCVMIIAILFSLANIA